MNSRGVAAAWCRGPSGEVCQRPRAPAGGGEGRAG